MKLSTRSAISGLSLALVMTQGAYASTISWNGGDGNWEDPNNWTPNTVPAEPGVASTADILVTNGEALYNAGSHGHTSNNMIFNGTLTLENGGAFRQVWNPHIYFGRDVGNTGTLQVNAGGTFSFGQNDQTHLGHNGGVGIVNVNGGTINFRELRFGEGSTSGGYGTLSVSNGGTLNVTGGDMTMNANSSLTISGATSVFHHNNAFRPRGATVNINDGTWGAREIQFQNITSVINLNGGLLKLHHNNSGANAYMVRDTGNTDSYINFTSLDAILRLEGGNAQLSRAETFVNDGWVRANGVIDPNLFVITQIFNNDNPAGYEITMIPEPGTVALMLAGGVMMLMRRR